VTDDAGASESAFGLLLKSSGSYHTSQELFYGIGTLQGSSKQLISQIMKRPRHGSGGDKKVQKFSVKNKFLFIENVCVWFSACEYLVLFVIASSISEIVNCARTR
jgi:hypothetical protein